MAVELCSEDSRSIIMSPRISFSGDVSPAEDVPVNQRNMRVSSSSSSIDFDFCVLDYESSSADELFLDGKILPIEIKRRMDDGADRKQSSKPWRFRRSSSLSCGSGALCPLPLLSRSNSTGSSSPITKDSFNSKPHYKKFSSSSIKQSHSVISATHYQKPPVKKFMSNGGIRINPVLNIPPASLFGLSSIFSGGKDKNKKKLSLFH
nr:probable membrane-associated kinase regulator 1 [Ipomoea batatas]